MPTGNVGRAAEFSVFHGTGRWVSTARHTCDNGVVFSCGLLDFVGENSTNFGKFRLFFQTFCPVFDIFFTCLIECVSFSTVFVGLSRYSAIFFLNFGHKSKKKNVQNFRAEDGSANGAVSWHGTAHGTGVSLDL